MLGALLVDRAARALLLDTFLAATRTRPHPHPSPASSSVLLGNSPLTGEASRPDLVCIAGKRSLVGRSEREVGNRRRTCNARVRMTGNRRNHYEGRGARCTYSPLRAHPLFTCGEQEMQAPRRRRRDALEAGSVRAARWMLARWRPARRWDDAVEAPSLMRKGGSPRRGRHDRASGGMRRNARSGTSREEKMPRCVEGFGLPRPRPKAHREAAGPWRSMSGRLRERRTPSTDHNR
jgi:hypothetical protein